MKLRTLGLSASAVVALLLAAGAAAVAFGGPTRPPPMQSISDPFSQVDFSAVPPLRRYPARDGAQLAYRSYEGQPGRGTVVLVHGSSANSQSLHPLARSLVQAGFTVYALDLRGHGESGPRGDIAYIGQLDDDLQDFMRVVRPAAPRTLVGFSAGGGFALRVAGGPRQALFDNYLFMAPYTSRHAATYRPDAGGWVSVGIPRVVALALLDRAGVSAFNHLPAVDFAVSDAPRAGLTPSYSYALVTNFAPHADYQADIRGIRKPAAVLVGANDEVFVADRFAQVFAEAGRSDIPVTQVPGAGHITLTLAPGAHAATVAAIDRLDAALPTAPTTPIDPP